MTIHTAILGYGRNGSTMHAGGVAGNSAFEMSAVCDIDAERQEQARERFGCPVYDDYHRMLDRETLDLVVIVTRSDQHCEMVCDCLDAGVNVLVTKPWAVDKQEAARMVAKSRETGLRLMPWLPARWGCDLRRLRVLLSEEAVGEVFMIRRACTGFGARNDWQTERRYGGGYLLNWGPHVVDPPLLLAGSPARTVSGRMGKAINPGDGEDWFASTITCENGIVVQAEYAVCVQHLPNWFIQGNRGTIIVHGRAIQVHKHHPGMPDDPTKYAAMRDTDDELVEETVEGSIYGDTAEIYAEIAADFAGTGTYPVTPQDAYELSVTLDAVRESHDSDQIVVPDYHSG